MTDLRKSAFSEPSQVRQWRNYPMKAGRRAVGNWHSFGCCSQLQEGVVGNRIANLATAIAQTQPFLVARKTQPLII
jgi:hypothetical protein